MPIREEISSVNGIVYDDIDEDGSFFINLNGAYYDTNTIRLYLEDVDGDENGSFESVFYSINPFNETQVSLCKNTTPTEE